MGTTTPNISIYIPAAGETNYDVAFAAGMTNVDQHDHSGAPTKGVPISTAGIAANSITYQLLNNNVIAPGGGLEFVVPTTQNQIQVAGVLKGIFGLSSNGFIARTGATTAASRTLTGTAGQIAITNPTGAAGDPVFSFDPTGFTLPTLTAPIVVHITSSFSSPIADFHQDYNGQNLINITNTTTGTASVAGVNITSDALQFCSFGVTSGSYTTGGTGSAGKFIVNVSTTNGMAVKCPLGFTFNNSSFNDPYLQCTTTLLAPGVDNTSDLGNGSFRWKEVFSAIGTINTSDANEKTEISELPYGMDLIEKLKPSIFKKKGSDQYHWGLIAQEVKEVLDQFTDGMGSIHGVYYDPKDSGGKGPLGLRYDQLIALLINGMQYLYKEVKLLKGEANGPSNDDAIDEFSGGCC